MITIKTKLLKEDDIDYLEFVFSDETKRVNINDPNDTTGLRSVFNKVTKLAMNSDVSLDALEVDPSIGGGLLADVFTEYITDLSQEISRIRAELRITDDED
jgi:hypothetical protein